MSTEICFHEDGWLFPNDRDANTVHELTTESIYQLIDLSEKEDEAYKSGIEQIVGQRDAEIRSGKPTGSHWELKELAVTYSNGAIVPYPNGLQTITFSSKEHLYRGENKKYSSCKPSLRRELKNIADPKEKELHFALAMLRKWLFADFLCQINVVPYWIAKISDVNFDALAQHYGFKTNLLDLTNDFKTALFFATCKYDKATVTFRPLTQQDIKQSEDTGFGYIYHTPSGRIDFLKGGYSKFLMKAHKRQCLQNGEMDGCAFQIGYQPLYRCHYQNGYVYPMRYAKDLLEDHFFEKLRFRQSEELSSYVYKMMDEGKKVFPNEGITEVQSILEQKIQNSVHFTDEQLRCVYELEGINKTLFPRFEDLLRAINGFQIPEGNIKIFDFDSFIRPSIPKELLEIVNTHYDGKDLLEPIGGSFYRTVFQQQYREQKCLEIFGRLID